MLRCAALRRVGWLNCRCNESPNFLGLRWRSTQKHESGLNAFSSPTSKQTHFGFRNVDVEEKQDLVGEVFDSVATSYDLMNDAMSLGVHRLWKNSFVSALRPTKGMKILDCAGGTGDIAFRILEQRGGTFTGKEYPVTVCDISAKMLDRGRQRARQKGLTPIDVEFVEANAEDLPMAQNSFDAYVISFGMRNVPRPDIALQEARRVLKPGGRFMMLEFAKVSDPLLSRIYDTYSFQIIPAIGELLARDRDAYKYLVESIRRFPDQDEFRNMMQEAGFVDVICQNYSFGLCALYSGYKPTTYEPMSR